MIRILLARGMLAGACGGAVAALVASVLGGPALDRAIAWEGAHAGPGDHGPPLVSRAVQEGPGLLAGSVVYGIALGGLIALAFAALYGRFSSAGVRRTALALGASAFVVVYLVPFLKYPATPPAVGDPDTIGQRTALHLGMVAISILAAVAALRIWRDLRPRLNSPSAALWAVLVYSVVAAGGAWALPAVDEVPDMFPADVIRDVRISSVAVQLALWTTITAVFGAAADRALRLFATATSERRRSAG